MRVERQESRVKSQRSAFALRMFSGSRLLTLSSWLPRPRRAVTLIELLIAMAIISMLAALILGVAARAAENARRANTQHTVLRLHRLLMSHYDTYKTRRVELRKTQGSNLGIKDLIASEIPNTVQNYAAKRREAEAEARLYALRELMLMEIPDRWSDVLLAPVAAGSSANTTAMVPLYLDASGSPTGRTGLANMYLRRYLALAARVNSVSGAQRQQALDALVTNESAECLYLVITLATGEGEARSQFGEGDIGDTDGDGAFEFLDGWGNPINFLRWAPGFDSQVQLNVNNFSANDAEWRRMASGDHDPFDLFRRDDYAFRLVPLIYSSGGDETAGLYTEPVYITWPKTTQFSVDDERPYLSPPLTPYELGTVNTGLQFFLGTKAEEGATDNVHNHLLGRR